MKTLRTLFVITIAITGFTFSSNADDHATATTSGTVVQTVAIANNRDLSFGSFSVNSDGGGVVIDADEAGARSTSGTGIVLQSGGTASSAKFTVTGYSGASYGVTKPATVTLSDGGSNTMDVTLTYSTITGVLTGGTEIIYVGGTLEAAASQPAGTYTNTTDLEITVAYE